jgi:RimJ/RimL family protein N-acetyltransferase
MVTLRAFEPDDVPALADYLNHPALSGRRYIPWEFDDTLPLPRKKVESIYERWSGDEKALHLAVVFRETGVLVGHTNCDWGWDAFCPRLAVVIAPECQRKGLGSEVARLMLAYLFENSPAHVVTAGFASWNDPARGFAHRLGLMENGAFRRVGIRNGAYVDWVVADILRREWAAHRGGQHAIGR